MGKRSKKLKEANNLQPSTPSEHLPDIIKNKKKRKHNLDLNPDNNLLVNEDVNTECEQIKAEEHELQNSVHVKKKKKKRHLDEQILEGDTEVSNVDEDTKVPKKKKKKAKLIEVEDTIQENGQFHDKTGELKEQKQKISKQKKIIDNLVNGAEKQEENMNNKVIVEAKGQKKKSKSKTGNAVLNEEESQVTEEDIDKFCDELDEEDNKQYEEWVKLIEASLPPTRAKN